MADKRQAQQQFAGQIQQLQQQMQQIQQKHQQIEQTIEHVDKTREGLRTLSEKEEQSAITPVGAGVYMNTTVEKTNTTLVEVGADVVVEKDTIDAINFLGDRKDQLMQAKQQYKQKLQQLQSKYQQFVSQIKQQQQQS